jgi:hypothetical protein
VCVFFKRKIYLFDLGGSFSHPCVNFRFGLSPMATLSVFTVGVGSPKKLKNASLVLFHITLRILLSNDVDLQYFYRGSFG